MLKSPRILLTDPLDDAALAALRTCAQVTFLDRPDEPTLARIIGGYDALIVRTYTRVSAAVLDRAARLRVIARAGVGLDNIDLAAARRLGIVVVHTPAAATDAVADLAVGLMLDVLRGISAGDAMIRADKFHEARGRPPAREFSELTLGIIGMGRIGRATARRCHGGFNMPVVFYDIVDPGPLEFPARSTPFDELIASADVVSLHVPLTALTRGMIDADALRRFKPGAILINTARGEVVDNAALAAALAEGRLGSAGLDVVYPEPLPAGHPLLSTPGVVFSPHAGARTENAQRRMCDVVADVLAVLHGQPPRYPAGSD